MHPQVVIRRHRHTPVLAITISVADTFRVQPIKPPIIPGVACDSLVKAIADFHRTEYPSNEVGISVIGDRLLEVSAEARSYLPSVVIDAELGC